MKKFTDYKGNLVKVFGEEVYYATNKKFQYYVDGYFNSRISTLEECYKSCSSLKKQAYNRIKNEMYEINDGKIIDASYAESFRIISFNSNIFTCGYMIEYIDPYTGEVYKILRYHSPSSVYNIYVGDII